MSDTYHVKEIQTWTHAWTNEFHIGEEFGTEVTYDAALIKEVGSNKWNWEYKHTDTKGDLKGFEKWVSERLYSGSCLDTDALQTDIAFTQDVPVANKSAVHVWAYTMKGEWDFEWKAKVCSPISTQISIRSALIIHSLRYHSRTIKNLPFP